MFNLKKKIILNGKKMLLRIVICSAFSLFVSSGLFAYGQSRLSGTLRLKAVNMAVKDVIAEIEKQSEYSFFYEDAKFDKDRKVSIDVDGKSIDDVIYDLFSEGDNSIYVEGKQVYIVQREEPKSKVSTPQQVVNKKTVKGVVVDRGGEPLIGASVSVAGSERGVITNLDGEFSIPNVDEGAIIQVSYIGYITQTFKATDTEQRIVLNEDSQVLEGVIVTALGIKRDEKALGYAAQRIDGDAATIVKGVDIRSALTGKIAGLQINNSPNFNDQPTLKLRGASPLIVVDGVPLSNVGLRELSPDDIESYDVLKGGSASALYGNAGRNGAIMITTKRADKDGVTVTVNSNTMFHSGFLKLPKVQSSYSSGVGGKYVNPQENPLDYVWGDKLDIGREAIQYNPFTYEYEMAPLTSKGKDNFTDFIESGLITNNNVNIAYKGQKGSFRSSLTHVYEKGVFPNNKMNKFTFSMAGDMKLSENVKFDASINYNKRYIPQYRGTGYEGNGYIYNLLVWTGTDYRLTDFKDYWVKGQEHKEQNWFYKKWYNNPYFLANEALASTYHDKLNAQFNLTYDPTSWLKTITRVGYDFYSLRDESQTPMSHRGNSLGSYSLTNGRSSTINGDFIVMAEHKISDFGIDGLVGGTINFTETNSHSASTKGGLSIPGFYSLAAGKEGQTSSSSVNKTQTNSIYGKIGLSYKSLLFVEATGRNDWSSRLDAENRSYFYPSVSASFIPSEIIPMPKGFEFWKLRGGWSVAKSLPSYAEINTAYSITTDVWNTTPGATYPDDFRPKSLKPQTQEDWEVGTEMYFLNGRLRFDLAYYQKKWSDRIGSVSISDASGYGYLYQNRGEELGRNGWELTVSGTPVQAKDFTWESSFNWTRERETYTRLDDQSSDNLWVYEGGRTDPVTVQKWERTEDGQLIHDGKSGMPIYKTKAEKIGYSNPSWIFGFTNTFKYKDFTLNLSFDGKIGGLMWDQTDQAMWHSGTHIDSDTPWRYDEVVNGKNNYIGQGVKVVSGEVKYDSYGQVISDTRTFAPNDIEVSYEDYISQWQPSTAGRIVEHQYKKKTFVKLRELSFAYNLPKNITSKLKINNASIAFVGQNLFIWTKDFKYSDPDIDERGLITPLVRYLGFNVKFDF